MAKQVVEKKSTFTYGSKGKIKMAAKIPRIVKKGRFDATLNMICEDEKGLYLTESFFADSNLSDPWKMFDRQVPTNVEMGIVEEVVPETLTAEQIAAIEEVEIIKVGDAPIVNESIAEVIQATQECLTAITQRPEDAKEQYLRIFQNTSEFNKTFCCEDSTEQPIQGMYAKILSTLDREPIERGPVFYQYIGEDWIVLDAPPLFHEQMKQILTAQDAPVVEKQVPDGWKEIEAYKPETSKPGSKDFEGDELNKASFELRDPELPKPIDPGMETLKADVAQVIAAPAS